MLVCSGLCLQVVSALMQSDIWVRVLLCQKENIWHFAKYVSPTDWSVSETLKTEDLAAFLVCLHLSCLKLQL